MTSTTVQSRPRVLSGMRPTGKLHLGNYMGALANWVKLQQDYDCYFFIADLHALTTDYADPSRLKLNTIDVALDWLAAGLDPENSTIFIQSHVPQHAELHLLFSMITPLGWLERVPTYKEQQENIKGKDLTTYGFLGYPLLQSADILLYQPQFVPVGQDQVAHVELTREVARRFNSMYRRENRLDVFPEPDALLTPSPKLPGTDGRKMSKSYGNTIGLTESPEVIRRKIYSMSTNGQRINEKDGGNPDLCPVYDLHKVFSDGEKVRSTGDQCRNAEISCLSCKMRAANSVVQITTPIFEKRQELQKNFDQTWERLLESSKEASARAEETMEKVREIFQLSRELSDHDRRQFASERELLAKHDLSMHSELWKHENDDFRPKFLRSYWRENLVPSDIALSQESNRVFSSIERELEEPLLSAKKKRIFVTTACERKDAEWVFIIPGKSYEVWVLLCWNKDFWLEDFIVPQKFYSQLFAKAKKSSEDGKVRVVLHRIGTKFTMRFNDFDSIDITKLRSDYDPLR